MSFFIDIGSNGYRRGFYQSWCGADSVAAVNSFILLPMWLDVEGIWLAMPVAEVMTTLVVIGLFLGKRC